MSKIDKTVKMRALVNTYIEASFARLTKIKAQLTQSIFAPEKKQDYNERLNKTWQQLEKVQTNLSKPNDNSYKDYINVQKQADQCISVIHDIKRLDANIRANIANQKQVDLSLNLPDAPTHSIAIKKTPVTTTVPDSILEKIVKINSTLSQANRSISQLMATIPHNELDEKIHRLKICKPLHEQQQTLQMTLDRIGVPLHKRDTEKLTPQQITTINKKLDALEKEVAILNNQILTQTLANAPKAPTGGLKPPSDDEPSTTYGPRR